MTSGPNRHYIPQALMRGFGRSTKSGKAVQVVAYFHDGRVVPTNTKNIGSARNFYPDSVDNKITDYENTILGKVLKKLRDSSVGTEVNAQEASELVVHLSTRQAEIGAFFSVYFRYFIDIYLSETVFNKKFLIKITGMNSRNYGFGKFALDKMYKTSNGFFKESKVPKIILDFVALSMFRRFLSKKIDDLLPEMRESLEQDVLSKIEDIAHQSHIDFLEKNIVSVDRLNYIKGFVWRIENHPQTAILPDCIALYSTDGRKFYSTIVVDHKKAIAVYMPLSHDKILVGRKGGKKIKVPLRINEMAAEQCSLFFVANDLKPEFVKLTQIIGTKARSEIKRIAKASIKKNRRVMRVGTVKRAHDIMQKQLEALIKHSIEKQPSHLEYDPTNKKIRHSFIYDWIIVIFLVFRNRKKSLF